MSYFGQKKKQKGLTFLGSQFEPCCHLAFSGVVNPGNGFFRMG